MSISAKSLTERLKDSNDEFTQTFVFTLEDIRKSEELGNPTDELEGWVDSILEFATNSGVNHESLFAEIENIVNHNGYDSYETMKVLESVSKEHNGEYIVYYQQLPSLIEKLVTLLRAKYEDIEGIGSNDSPGKNGGEEDVQYQENDDNSFGAEGNRAREDQELSIPSSIRQEEDKRYEVYSNASKQEITTTAPIPAESKIISLPQTPVATKKREQALLSSSSIARTIHDKSLMDNVRGHSPIPSPFKQGMEAHRMADGHMNRSMIMRIDPIQDQQNGDVQRFSHGYIKARPELVESIAKTMMKEVYYPDPPEDVMHFAELLDESTAVESNTISEQPSKYIRVHKPYKNEVFIIDGHRNYTDGTSQKARVFKDDISKSPYRIKTGYEDSFRQAGSAITNYIDNSGNTFGGGRNYVRESTPDHGAVRRAINYEERPSTSINYVQQPAYTHEAANRMYTIAEPQKSYVRSSGQMMYAVAAPQQTSHVQTTGNYFNQVVHPSSQTYKVDQPVFTQSYIDNRQSYHQVEAQPSTTYVGSQSYHPATRVTSYGEQPIVRRGY